MAGASLTRGSGRFASMDAKTGEVTPARLAHRTGRSARAAVEVLVAVLLRARHARLVLVEALRALGRIPFGAATIVVIVFMVILRESLGPIQPRHDSICDERANETPPGAGLQHTKKPKPTQSRTRSYPPFIPLPVKIVNSLFAMSVRDLYSTHRAVFSAQAHTRLLRTTARFGLLRLRVSGHARSLAMIFRVPANDAVGPRRPSETRRGRTPRRMPGLAERWRFASATRERGRRSRSSR
jgi:hypothetical protein